MINHAIGIGIGNTTVVNDKARILHTVTLVSTAQDTGHCHAKLRHGVLLDAGYKIIRNIEISEGSRVGAGVALC